VHQFLTPCFVVRKTFSRRGLKSCLPSQIGWIPDCIIRMCQWVTDFDCCHRPSVDLSSQWGFLMKIIATMHNADWAAIISRVAGVVVLVVAVLRTQVPQVKLRHDPDIPSNLCHEWCVIGVSSDAARGLRVFSSLKTEQTV